MIRMDFPLPYRGLDRVSARQASHRPSLHRAYGTLRMRLNHPVGESAASTTSSRAIRNLALARGSPWPLSRPVELAYDRFNNAPQSGARQQKKIDRETS
jgi:hypothetical protein